MGRTEQIPPVAFAVDEDDEATVRLIARFGGDRDAVFEHSLPRLLEVIDTQKQSHATGELFADRLGLALAGGLRQQRSSLSLGWSHDELSLRTTVVGRRQRVLDDPGSSAAAWKMARLSTPPIRLQISAIAARTRSAVRSESCGLIRGRLSLGH